MNVVVALGGVGLSGPKGDRVKELILLVLTEDTGAGKTVGIGVQIDQKLGVEMAQD